MMLWINGTFGVGKTTVGKALVEAQAALRLFDPEAVGYMLMHNLKDQAFSDFQVPAWRALVPYSIRNSSAYRTTPGGCPDRVAAGLLGRTEGELQ